MREPVAPSFFCGQCRAPVFHSCGLTAAEMTLGLVELQNRLCLGIQSRIQLTQPLGEILVYGGLADAEFFRGRADGTAIFGYVLGEAYGPRLKIAFQIDHSKTFYSGKYMLFGASI